MEIKKKWAVVCINDNKTCGSENVDAKTLTSRGCLKHPVYNFYTACTVIFDSHIATIASFIVDVCMNTTCLISSC